jgi:membrane-associated protease RseP (regulator of RpoE activity)
MSHSERKLLLGFAIILIAVSALYATINANLPGVVKFFLGVFELVLSGTALEKVMGLKGYHGMLLLRSKKGFELIDGLAKDYAEQCKLLADFGLIIGFGFAGFLAIRKKKEKFRRTALFFFSSFAVLFLMSLFITPNLIPMLSPLLPSADISTASSHLQSATRGNSLILVGMLLLLFAVGVAGSGAASVIGYGIIVSFATVSSFIGGKLPEAAPGATIVLPGVTIPFFEGIIALAVLLLVHETAHGILARVANVKLKYTGLVFFGVIPAGAFVDPDEGELGKRSSEEQNRVLVAGSTANILTTLIAFFLLSGFIFATASWREEVVRIEIGNSLIPAETIITHINGVKISELENRTFAPNSSIVLTLENGSALLVQSDGEGRIGSKLIPYTIILKDGTALSVGKDETAVSTWNFYYPPSFGWMAFIYTTLVLITALNFVVGVVNLLPIPSFDGHRLLDINVRNKHAVNALTAIVVVGFLLNFLPWLFM